MNWLVVLSAAITVAAVILGYANIRQDLEILDLSDGSPKMKYPIIFLHCGWAMIAIIVAWLPWVLA